MTDTPETDNLALGNHVVPTEFAQQLERQRDSLKNLHNENAVYLAELLELCGTLSKELSTVTEQLDSLAPSAWTLDWQAGPYPHTMRVVLATDGENIWSATYTKEDGWQDAYSGEPVDYYITYWCEVPELPQS